MFLASPSIFQQKDKYFEELQSAGTSDGADDASTTGVELSDLPSLKEK